MAYDILHYLQQLQKRVFSSTKNWFTFLLLELRAIHDAIQIKNFYASSFTESISSAILEVIFVPFYFS
jgi:hypothetical protein